jgi:hypothetical protein
LNHELAHIRQKHWFDLALVELLCMLQWFNPLVWIYIRFIRQNHEYLADKVALQRSSDPAIYKAALLNQIVGSPVVNLANSFSYSINKKRFNVMKNIISSPYRKMKILLIFPVFAIVLYSFAKPEYRYVAPDENSGNNMPVSEMQKKVVPGSVVQQDGKPLQRAAIVVNETTPGISTDTIKHFNSNIGTPPPPPPPAPHLNSEVPLMITGTPPSPPPPPSTGITFKGGNENTPLIVVDGVVRDIDVNKIDPNTIESISVIKGESGKKLYGEKGKEGVIEITTKK